MEPSKLTLTARSPEDVLAMVPVVLGFTPTDSLVMLTFGEEPRFHARVDLPDREPDIRQVTAALLEPVARHGVPRVVLVAYSDDVDRADRVTATVRDAFAAAGVEVLGRLAADGARWWHLPRQVGDPGTAYDVTAHPFAAQAVWSGLVTHGCRDDLAASLAPDPDAVASTERRLAAGPLPLDPSAAGDEAVWAAELVRRCVAERRLPRHGGLARLLVGMRDLTVRDAVWFTQTRPTAQAHLEFWTGVVRCCPASHLAAPAAVLGFAAWLAGQGALAWCAVDRVRAVDPDYSMAALLARGLAAALPPSTWDAVVGDVRDHAG